MSVSWRTRDENSEVKRQDLRNAHRGKDRRISYSKGNPASVQGQADYVKAGQGEATKPATDPIQCMGATGGRGGSTMAELMHINTA